MQRLSLALTAGLLLAVGGSVYAQDAKKDEISFKTFDGVLLKGSFYPSSKGGNAPVVMFLHKFGADRTKGEWDALARKLQESGYAVLSFDFRGHGQSVNLTDPALFWAMPANRAHVKGSNNGRKQTISFKDFNAAYIPYLVNDIVAARYDLDVRNDGSLCNTSNIIVIGAEEGASLGFLWISTEHYREAVYKKGNIFDLNRGNVQAGSEDIAGAIWLSITRSPESVTKARLTFPYSTMVNVVPAMRGIPMWFAVGQNDKDGVADANYLYDSVLRADSVKPKLETTFKKPIVGTNLRGAALLGKDKLTTNDDIDKYIKKLVERRPNTARKDRDTKFGDTTMMYVPLQSFGFR